MKQIRPRDIASYEKRGYVVRHIRETPGGMCRYYAGKVLEEWPKHHLNLEEQLLHALQVHHTPLSLAKYLEKPRKIIAAMLCKMRDKGMVAQRGRGVWYAM